MKISKRVLPHENVGKLPDIQSTNAPDGIRGNLDTVNMIKKIARKESGDPLVRRIANNIVNYHKIPSHSYLEEARAIGAWVQQNMRYVRDADGIEQLTSPNLLLRHMTELGYMTGDCDDMSVLISALLLSIGCVPTLRCVRYKSNSGHYNHIYVVVYEQNHPNPPQRLVLDAIIKNKPIGTEMPHQSGDDFPV
jgi:hypothetical protein